MKSVKKVLKKIETNPLSAINEANHLILDVSPLSQRIRDSDAKDSEKAFEFINNQLAYTLITCAVQYGNKSNKWGESINLLNKAEAYAIDQKLKDQITKNLNVATSNVRVQRENKTNRVANAAGNYFMSILTSMGIKILVIGGFILISVILLTIMNY